MVEQRISPSKGRQGTTRGKEKSFDLGGNRTHDPRIRSTVLSTSLGNGLLNTEKSRCIVIIHLFSQVGLGNVPSQSFQPHFHRRGRACDGTRVHHPCSGSPGP